MAVALVLDRLCCSPAPCSSCRGSPCARGSSRRTRRPWFAAAPVRGSWRRFLCWPGLSPRHPGRLRPGPRPFLRAATCRRACPCRAHAWAHAAHLRPSRRRASHGQGKRQANRQPETQTACLWGHSVNLDLSWGAQSRGPYSKSPLRRKPLQARPAISSARASELAGDAFEVEC